MPNKFHINRTTVLTGQKTEGSVEKVLPLGEGSNIVEFQCNPALKDAAVSCVNDLDTGNIPKVYITAPGAVFVINRLKFDQLINGTIIVLVINGAITVKHNITADASHAGIFLNGGVDMVVATIGTLTVMYDDNIGAFVELSRMVV